MKQMREQLGRLRSENEEVCVCVDVGGCLGVYTYMHIHTYIHTDMHTYIQADRQTDIRTYVYTYIHYTYT